MAMIVDTPAPPATRPAAGTRLLLRASWIAVQLLLAYLFAQQGERFFYQGF